MPLTEQDHKRLDQVLVSVQQALGESLGYPVARDLDYEELAAFLNVPLNNVGDPYSSSTWRVETHQMELEVIDFFTNLFRAGDNPTWGYVTNGGSEGNLYGLYLARELHPQGIVYYSEDTHYSVSKNLHLLNMRHIMIRSQPNGEIDYTDLEETVKIHRDVAAIIFANIGTTMTEAKDDVGKIRAMLDRLAVHNRYIHSDAALCGPMAPFLEPRPAFDFADGADSIAVSGHKFIGSPVPSGVVLARKVNVDRIARAIAYIGSLDTTITGSRNGLTPLILWCAVRRFGEQGLKQRVADCLDVADYAEQRLREVGVDVRRNPNAITLIFPAPPESIIKRFQLATVNKQSHIITMPGVSRDHIDSFLDELRTTGYCQ